uniref:Ubiquitin-like domain-containing protein n=1 Tax=Biomphalaria glabrata TaxID=6526 RepID=A0A2C9LZS8_BIOGL
MIRADPVQGWGYGHQGERQFSTAPAYNSIPYPQDVMGSQDSLLEDSDEDELDPFDAIYGELDLQRVYGQQLAIWTHRNPDTVALFTPIQGDTFMNIVTFARTSLQFNSAVDKMMVLLPGHKRPLDMDSVFIVKPGTAILIAPLYDYMVTLEVKQLNQKIDMVIHITMTVLELKTRLHTERGYPVDRIDLLYKDRPLENVRYLFEYNVAHSSTLFVLLNLKNDILVHVETFWGKQYHLYVDSSTTGFGIIASILRRTVSQMIVDVVQLYELFLPKHSLVLYLGSRVIDWDNCLGFYGIEDGSVLTMSTIGLANDMAIQPVPVTLDDGREKQIMVSKFDRWSVVALKLHGMTGYPVNLMQLIKHGSVKIDFSDTVGSTTISKPVKLDVSAMKVDDDLLYGIPLKFKIARGITELLKVAPSRTIKSVKETLERIGVPNASLFDLVIDGYKLPNNKRVVDVIEEYKVPIELSLKQYPVFIHGHQNVIYKMLAYSKETLATFLMRVNMKTGLSFDKYLILVCGTVLDDDENLPVFDTKISLKSSLFLIPRKQYRSFFVLHGDLLAKIRIPMYPKSQQIKDILWKERHVPEGGLASIGTFLQWYFGAHNRDGSTAQLEVPLKERMMVYEQKIGNKYLHMKVEPQQQPRTKTKHKHGQILDNKALDKLVKLEHQKRHRNQSLPPGHDRRKLRLPQLPRHMSADALRATEQHGHKKRKAYTTDAKFNRGHHNIHRNRSDGQYVIPPPVYKYTDGGSEENKEWVFCLRHDYTLPVKGNKQRIDQH